MSAYEYVVSETNMTNIFAVFKRPVSEVSRRNNYYSLLEDYHSDKYLVYILASVFEMVSSLLSISGCLYGRCLLLSHSLYLILLLPPLMMLPLVPHFGQCGLWYTVHCLIS